MYITDSIKLNSGVLGERSFICKRDGLEDFIKGLRYNMPYRSSFNNCAYTFYLSGGIPISLLFNDVFECVSKSRDNTIDFILYG